MKDQTENIRGQKARYYKKHKEKILAKDRLKYQRDPLKTRAQRIRRDYGITIDEYDRMLAMQGHKCAVCRQPEIVKKYGKVQALAVDHDHKTGKVRALLCQACNVALGALRDDPVLIRALAAYREMFLGE